MKMRKITHKEFEEELRLWDSYLQCSLSFLPCPSLIGIIVLSGYRPSGIIIQQFCLEVAQVKGWNFNNFNKRCFLPYADII